MSTTLNTVLENATVYSVKVQEYMYGTYNGDTLDKVIASYVLIAMQHHESLIQLVTGGKWISAFALGRPMYEAFIRATWLSTCEGSKSVNKAMKSLYKGHDDFPTLLKMGHEIDKSLGEDLLKNEDNIRKMLNSTAHGGSFLLSRCMDEDKVTPQVNEDEAIALMRVMTVNLLLTVLAFAGKIYDEKMVKKIQADIKNYEG